MATFFERLCAYIVDIIIITLITSVICLGIDNKNNNQELMQQLDEKLINSEISTEEYLAEYKGLLYDYQKSNTLSLGITLATTIAYFVVFQYMNKGQTLGKKLLKIRVVNKETSQPISIVKGLIRSLFTLSIASGILNIMLMFILNKNSYYISYIIISAIELIFSIITIMFILYKKDKRGLHDLMAGSIVIKEMR